MGRRDVLGDESNRILARLKDEGVTVDARVEESEFGKFGWIMDPEGNRIELWEPPTTTGG